MENEWPLVSIITGYYNRKENLGESINSVLQQSYANFEYIVFDDCSTDGTRELLQQFEGRDKFRLSKHDVNIGLTKGLIKAIASARGKYIAIHGAGDISFKNRIEKQVEILENRPEVGVVGCLMEDISGEGRVIISPAPKTPKGSYVFSHGEVMFRRSLYYRVGGYNALFKYGQFTMLKFEILKLSEAAFVNEILYRRIHYKNGVTKNKNKRLEQILSVQLGLNISKFGLWNVDLSRFVIAYTFQNIALVKKGTSDESRLLWHLKKRYLLRLIYNLYRVRIIPQFFVKTLGSLMRRRNGW